MKYLVLIFFIAFICRASGQKAGDIDLSHWRLELPTGYKASEWKLSNFQNDRFAKPFFYLDTLDGALVMEAYPAKGTSKSKYTRNTLREQLIPGSSEKNWTLEEGGILTTELQVVEMSKETTKKYHRTLLLQIHGTTSDEQEESLGISKSISLPLLSVYWQNERIRVVRRVLKDPSTNGDDLLKKDSWENDAGRYFGKKVSFDKIKLRVEASDGRVEVHLNDLKPFVYKDTNIRKWPFENYFNVGNYLQTKDYGSKSIVKYYELEASH
ncbi:MAG: polysaccharide lyase family 7 protein [Bacteroidota bacterium]